MKRILQISILVLLAVMWIFIGLSYAATIEAASCSLADVQTAVNSAARGDTVMVPKGACTWTGRLNIRKAIKLVGAGNTEDANGTRLTFASTDATRLTSDWNDDCGLNLEYSTSTTEHIVYKTENAQLDQDEIFEITGFVFYQGAPNQISYIAIVNGTPLYPLKKIKVHGNLFRGRTDSSASLWSPVFGAHGRIYGVFYDNVIYTKKPYIHISGSNRMDINGINDGSCNTNSLGYWTWRNANTYKPGLQEVLFFEDNTWYFDTTTAVHMGGITHGGEGPTIRYNTYINSSTTNLNQGGHDLHGAYRGRNGPMGMEVYGNHWLTNSTYTVILAHMRAGRNIVFNNLVQRQTGGTTAASTTLVQECNECAPNFGGYTGYTCQAGISTKIDAECAGKSYCSFDNQPPMMSSTYIFQNAYGDAGTTRPNVGTSAPTITSKTTCEYIENKCACDTAGVSWTNTSGTIYSTDATTETYCVSWNSNLLTKGTSTSPSSGQWFWASNKLYVNVGVNPTTGNLCFKWHMPWSPIENQQWWRDNTDCSGSGTCASGVGCGSATPTGNCTVGTAYWKTDQSCTTLTAVDVGAGGTLSTKERKGTLYRCSAPNTWTPWFTPAEYPHPLRGYSDTQPGQLSLPTACSGEDCTTPLACNGDDDDVVIGVTAKDNVGITGVKCCLENGSTCISATTYENMNILLSLYSGTAADGIWKATVTNTCNSSIAYNCKGTDFAENITPNIANSYDMEAEGDTTDPTLSTQSLEVLGRTLTLVFSEPVRRGGAYLDSQWTFTVDGTPISIECPTGAGWDTNTIICQVSECVADGAVLTLDYAQPGVGLGITDQSDNTFTIGDAVSVTNNSEQTCGASSSLFDHSDVPSHSVYPWGAGTNGIRFKSATQGILEEICFYKNVAMVGTHSGGVWNDNGLLLGSLTFTDEPESGWVCQALETGINILADTYYRVGVHFTAQRAYTNDFYNTGYTSSDTNLSVDANDGSYSTYSSSLSFPTDPAYNPGRNWWVDFIMSFADEGGPWQMTVSNVSAPGEKCTVSGNDVIDDGNAGEVEVTTANGWKATFSGCGSGTVVQVGNVYTYTTAAITENCTVEVNCEQRRSPLWLKP